jgi:hypothetical protein
MVCPVKPLVICNSFLRTRFWPSLISFGGSAICTVSMAQEPPIPDATHLPSQTTPVARVVVPIPSETFASLDKYGDVNWSAVQRPALAHSAPHGDATGIALILGVVIAEGFVAVEAKDPAEIKALGKAVLAHARALGVEQMVMKHSKSIVERAEKGDWTAVRKEWDGVLPDVKQAMREVKSEQLSQLVSLGGWLRGTGALASVVLQRYSSQGAELLRQPALLDYLEAQLNGMKNKPNIAEMKQGIRKMRVLIAGTSQPISQKTVHNIALLCDELLWTLNGRREPSRAGDRASVANFIFPVF